MDGLGEGVKQRGGVDGIEYMLDSAVLEEEERVFEI